MQPATVHIMAFLDSRLRRPLRKLPRLPRKRDSRVCPDTEDALTLTLSRSERGLFKGLPARERRIAAIRLIKRIIIEVTDVGFSQSASSSLNSYDQGYTGRVQCQGRRLGLPLRRRKDLAGSRRGATPLGTVYSTHRVRQVACAVLYRKLSSPRSYFKSRLSSLTRPYNIETPGGVTPSPSDSGSRR